MLAARCSSDDVEEVMAEEASCWSLEVVVVVVAAVVVVVVVVVVETETLLASRHPQPKVKHRSFFFNVCGVVGPIGAGGGDGGGSVPDWFLDFGWEFYGGCSWSWTREWVRSK